MARIAVARAAAEPTSPRQRARRRRILRAAERLGAESDLEHVQMQEVARRSGVAIATLYRYFPSKTHLFIGVMAYQIEQLSEALVARPQPDGSAADCAFDVLVRANRSLLRTPFLVATMMKSANGANVEAIADVVKIDNTMRDIVLTAARMDTPTADDLAVVRVLLQAWSGILAASLSGRLSMLDAESDLKLACQLLLGSAQPQ